MSARQYSRLLPLCVAVALLALVAPTPQVAHAATFTVTITTDAPHTTPLNGNCTSTLPGNPCTLRAAIQAVNFLGGGPHTINLSVAGIYALTVTGRNEQAAATGDLDINGVDLTINNSSGGSIAVDGTHIDRVFDIGAQATAQVTINDITIQGGTAFIEFGGGVRVNRFSSTSRSTLVLNQVTIINNRQEGDIINASGGGIHNNGSISINNSVIAQNRAGTICCSPTGTGSGGGISGEGDGVLTNVVLRENCACPESLRFGASGGGIAGGVTSLLNVTLVNNMAAAAGGQSFGAGISVSLSLKNTILAGNRTRDDTGFHEEVNCHHAVVSLGNNIDGGSTCNLSGPGDLSNTDPRLATDGQPQSDSPAVDAGTNSGCPANDVRDRTRPIDGNGDGLAVCDIGAFEYQPPPFAATRTPTRTITPTGTITPTPTATTGAQRTATATATPTPGSLSVAQAIAQVQATFGLTGQVGVPSAATLGDVVTVQGAVTGTGRVLGSMAWTLTALVPAGVAPGTVPVAVVATTAGLQGFPCAPVAAGAGTVGCVGTTAANALQGSTVVVVFGPGLVATGTVTGPGPRGAQAVLALPLQPPPPPLLPLPPPPAVMAGGPLMAGRPGGMAPAEVPVIPEAESGWLVLAGLLGVAGWRLRTGARPAATRRRWRAVGRR